MEKYRALLPTILMTLYFAYGSNMDLLQMGDRCPGAVTVSRAELPSYRFIINTGGVATVVPDPPSTVQGLLWKISKKDERSLSRYEGVKHGIYKKAFVRVRLPNGTTTRALIYVAADSHQGTARPGYLEKVVSGAEGCGLPESYIDQLKRWQP
ncbi:MAG TPA: gamma-glutamylcyclotransferase family protein [Syntrophorhabdales bacterium]|nr:gamma-glutamylcyclotransferase family protein [Syntrophorhabdales bacterium]